MYIVSKDDIADSVQDFVRFCEYIKYSNPTATQKGDLSVKACWEINQILFRPEENVKPNSRMDKYPSVILWFRIALESGIIEYSEQTKNKTVLDVTGDYNTFLLLDACSQYMMVFQTWLYMVNFEDMYENIRIFPVDAMFDELTHCDSSKWQELEDDSQNSFFGVSPMQMLMRIYYKFAVNLMDMGLLICEKGISDNKYAEHPIIKRLKPTTFGINIMKACDTRRYSWFNEYTNPIVRDKNDMKLYERTTKALNDANETFLTPLISLFPKGSVNEELIDSILFGKADKDNRVYDFNVSLGKIFNCTIRCSAGHSFEDLHLKIQEAVDFDNDHLYSFYLDGKRYSRKAVNAPESYEPPYADETRLGDVNLRNNQKILYLFDYGDCWEFDIKVKITDATAPDVPEIINVTGEQPEQYPNYDDWEE